MTATTAPLVVKHAATVVCARIRAKGVQTLALDEIRKGAELWSDDRVGHLFPKGGSEVSFTSGWELLMGQGECVNYLRSTPSVTKLMRYSGEYKFAGGGVDGNETLEAAGRRELEEEFLTVVPKNANLRLFKVMQTRPVQNTSYIMSNYVCLEEENPWLKDLDAATINDNLAAKRARFEALVASGEFFDLPTAEKELVSPEVRRVDWLDMKTAVTHAFTSMNSEVTYVNQWQEETLKKLKKKRRDPLFITMTVMTELEAFPTLQSIQTHCNSLVWSDELRRVAWLTDGMSVDAVAEIMEEREEMRRNGELDDVVKTAEVLAAEKKLRRQPLT